MNVQQIEYVLAASTSRTFGEAASKCYVTQSTLSTMVARLESELGVIIFDRKTKPVSVTVEGEKIIHQLKIISKEISNLDHVVDLVKGQSGNVIEGDLKLGAIPTIAPFVLPQFLRGFLHKNSKLKFEVSEIPTQKIIDQLLSRDIDVGLVSIPLKHEDLVELPLYTEPFHLYDRNFKEGTIDVNIEEIDFTRLWLLEEGHCMRNQVEKICEIKNRSGQIDNLIYKSGTINTLLKLVNQNNGLTLLPHLATLDLSKSEKKFLHRFSDVVPVRRVGLVVHKHFVKKKVLRKLQEAIQQKIMPLIGKVDWDEKVIDPLYD